MPWFKKWIPLFCSQPADRESDCLFNQVYVVGIHDTCLFQPLWLCDFLKDFLSNIPLLLLFCLFVWSNNISSVVQSITIKYTVLKDMLVEKLLCWEKIAMQQIDQKTVQMISYESILVVQK